VQQVIDQGHLACGDETGDGLDSGFFPLGHSAPLRLTGAVSCPPADSAANCKAYDA
jgi:hypothetical protein